MLRKIAPAACLLAAGCASARGTGPGEAAGMSPALRVLAEQRGVRVGVAADAALRDAGGRALIAREFGMLTPENDMKHARIHPQRDVYYFARADSLVAFAEANGMRVRGHTLVWHRQNAPWLTGGQWTADEVRSLLGEHIDSVAGRYRGKVQAWDVVNEAFEESGALRNSFWLQRLGPDYIEFAFRRAAAADPGALLFYNDYNIEGINPKSDSTYEMVRRLRARGVPIHGVGLQAHFIVGQVPATLRANMERFAALGLKVQITELDVRLPQPATAAHLEAQARDYRAVMDACLGVRGCDAVVLWGASDRWSWIPGEFPGWGQAHVFDEGLRPKPAYRALHELLKGAAVQP